MEWSSGVVERSRKMQLLSVVGYVENFLVIDFFISSAVLSESQNIVNSYGKQKHTGFETYHYQEDIHDLL